LDNLTHSLAGWALGQAGLKTRSRKGLAALILAANMPDIDVFFGRSPWEPLAMHRGFTHSLVGGVLVMPPILFGLLLLLDRWQLARGATFKSGLPMRPWWLLALCYLGALTHPFLDLLTTYSVQLMSPFSGRWFHADGLFIIDVWIWLALALAIGISKRREDRGREWRRLPQAAIALVIVYVGANLAISDRAIAAVRVDRSQAEAIFASPPPVAFWQRRLVWREGDCYRWAAYDPVNGRGAISRCEATLLRHPAVRAAIRGTPALQSFLRWSVLPQADIKKGRCAVKVTLSDARYGDRRRSLLGRDVILPTGAPGC